MWICGRSDGLRNRSKTRSGRKKLNFGILETPIPSHMISDMMKTWARELKVESAKRHHENETMGIEREEGGTLLHVDNQSSIKLAKIHVFHEPSPQPSTTIFLNTKKIVQPSRLCSFQSPINLGGGGKQDMSLEVPREELSLWVPSFSRAAGNKQVHRADGREGLLHVFFSPYWTKGHVQIRFRR